MRNRFLNMLLVSILSLNFGTLFADTTASHSALPPNASFSPTHPDSSPVPDINTPATTTDVDPTENSQMQQTKNDENNDLQAMESNINPNDALRALHHMSGNKSSKESDKNWQGTQHDPAQYVPTLQSLGGD